jgi:DNA polymerase-3 subunit delta'
LNTAMAFKDFSEQQQGVQMLQRSLERGRLAHAYLFTGHQLELLETLARTLVKTLNCLDPIKRGSVAIDCCDHCLACRKIEHENHPDVHWVRPESKSRVITIDQMREVMREIQLKSSEGAHKTAIVVAADRLRVEAANAFLKTLEEPPPGSILMLLTTDPQRVLETILSRCLRLSFAGEGLGPIDPAQMAWLAKFSAMAAQEQKSLLGRYRLLDVLLQKLNTIKANIEEALTSRSPLQRYKEVEKSLSDKWETELAAAVEAEYRRQRLDLLAMVEWWLRDVWLRTLPPATESNGQKSKMSPPEGAPEGGGKLPEADRDISKDGLLSFPQMVGVGQVAQRISSKHAKENLEILEQLQRRLNTNVQEALALEVGLLKLNL